MGFKGSMYIWKDRKRFMGMPLSFTRYAMSEDRLFFSVGFFSIRDEELLLYRVRDMSVKRNLWQRLFKVGSIVINSTDKSTPQFTLKNIKHPMKIKELLHNNIEETKMKRRMRIGEMMTDVHDDDADFDDEIPDLN
ncbi:MAG: PH domain-containing protein [Ruminococcaceae bacterium]|nr:PH domain-containing protein [Oscillospiraceae bacterium]